MIPEGTRLAANGSPLVEEAPAGTFVVTYPESGIPQSVAVNPQLVELDVEDLIEVETWFEAGCRDCQHKTNVGFIFRVSVDARLLLKNGEFFEAGALQPGMRLRSIGCKCGYEEVKEARWVTSTPVDLYDIQVSNFGITDGEHIVLVEGAPTS